MSVIRQEILSYIDNIPDSKLEALKPLLSVLASDMIIIETDLSDEEREIIAKGREEYARGSYVPLESL